MRIGFVGDIHGCVHQCLGALLDVHRDARLDMIIQVGDVGAWPNMETMFAKDPAAKWFVKDNPRQLEWFDLLNHASANADAYREVRDELGQPILMIRGNHDDPAWLQPGPVDPFDVFHFVPDGAVMIIEDVRIGFLGGIEVNPDWPIEVRQSAGMHSIDAGALERLENTSIDVLVTHDGPYGVAQDWRGAAQGSRALTELVERAGPRWHVAGHYHHAIGPQRQGRAQYVGLSCLVHPLTSKWDSGASDPLGRVQPSSIGVLDTDTGYWAFPAVEAMQRFDKGWQLRQSA
jgi:Icc-related predicted phosphoesterase